MEHDLAARAFISRENFGIDVFIFSGDSVCTNLTLEKVPFGEYRPPTMNLSLNNAQRLMNDLWNAGVRPTEVDSPGELRATKKHLEDMRDIAFNKLEMRKPDESRKA